MLFDAPIARSLHALFGNINRIRASIAGQMPFVLRVSRMLREKNRDAACKHGVENRTPREGIPLGLQAEHGVAEESHHFRRLVADAQPFLASQQFTTRRRRTLLQDLASDRRPLESGPRRASEGEEDLSPLGSHSLLPSIYL